MNGTAHPTVTQFYASRVKFFHVSAKIVRNPKAALAEALGQPYDGPQFVPERGTTYNKGRNKAKRGRRQAVWGGGVRK